ncbi:LPXTG cell wall anchor domain-containing protein [Streptacidiphilus sp. N1-10]|uniref:LPXTG cell wall anchor domain-containing protein n=1 Tax=Streptacidiphilus jeojiensis TaxID=3229225 RepID=A0ABV6Y185_9ACTN
MRVAAAGLALAGTGLLVSGVASAATTPDLVQTKVVDGPQDSAVTLNASASDAAATDTATASDEATTTDPTSDPAESSTGTPSASATASATGSAASSAATAASSASAAASASASPSASGSAGSGVGSGSSGGGGASAPQPRQTLAETGTDDSAPLLFAGGLTLLAGGLVFRFGPRTGTPRHAA